ncbi:glycosyltransferase [Hyphomonas sp.]|uniref:glycosyltransferase n=1 Tax=Hyphomonas sp. TaxID=87 RepID=UPI003529CDE6
MSANSVTVLIPTFNRAAFLVEALDSILAQTRRPDEIIVINDGSTDDTIERLEPYKNEIGILNQDNSGKSAALNKALGVAKGDLIWVFDDDDIAEPDALETLLGLLASDPDADFAYGRHDRFEVQPNGQVTWKDTGYWRKSPPEDFLFETLLDMFAHQPGMLVRRSLYQKAGPFDESLIRSQDYDMLLRLAQHGRPAPTERILFHQRQHDLPRGTAGKVVEVAERNAVWQKNDRKIFAGTFQVLPLGKYLPTNVSLTGAGMTRRALIRRGIVMGRKNYWKEAGEDFKSAARISDPPLTREEITDLRQMFMTKYGCDEYLLDRDVQKLFFDIKHASPVGKQMAAAAARAMAWRVRFALQSGKPLLAFKLASFVIGLIAPYPHILVGDSSPSTRS